MHVSLQLDSRTISRKLVPRIQLSRDIMKTPQGGVILTFVSRRRWQSCHVVSTTVLDSLCPDGFLNFTTAKI
jgi:hypothetical protein